MIKKKIVNNALNQFDKNDHYYNCDEYIGSFFLGLKLFYEQDKNVFILTKNNHLANKLNNLFANYLHEEDVILMPSDELIRVEYISQSKEMLAQQISSLYRIINAKHKIIIASTQSLFRFYPSKDLFLNSCLKLEVNCEYNLEEIKKKLVEIGYYRVNKIDQSLQFANRGDILDIYTLNYENPIRIEFFGDTIESIRFFKISDQISIEKINSVDILPATINLLTNDEMSLAKNTIINQYKKDIENIRDSELLNTFEANLTKELELIDDKEFDNKFYKYMGFLQGFYSNLTDFNNDAILIKSNETAINQSLDSLIKESDNFLSELYSIGKCISNLHYYSYKNCKINNNYELYYIDEMYDKDTSKVIELKAPSYVASRQSTSSNIFNLYNKEGYKILCFLPDLIYKRKTIELLKNLSIKYSENSEEINDCDVILSSEDFPLGFEFYKEKIAILTDKELYGIKRHKSSYKSIFKEGTIINSYEELIPGDYVVHENYGIGEYVGITTIELNKIHQDYMEVHYANSEKLYVPLYQFNLIRKYVGREGKRPTLSKLSTNQWEKTKKKIKERVNELAERLLTLYQERSQIEGYSFKIEDSLQKEFEDEFLHELTYDQKKAIDEIKKDMENTTPMDRLLCGDVGFGKTEVAFRAAFKALNNGKQVALLCPTTLLARQHYELALERFKNFDFGIGMLSRLQTNKQNEDVIKDLKDGKINFVIGTHKVLSKNVIFKDLGLLIIDEEQRFGVEQKEKIKERSTNIDVLTLSATPIPRTLQSTLVGLKTTSSITTPPKERMPIQTYVIPFDNKAIKEIIQRELSRQGQAFLIHNEISSIYERASEIQSLLSECKIGVIHAKMQKTEIEDTMLDFYNGNIDLLVATSIIENGIDVRNANLIIVDNADHFGLAQLYQIKGRVGRGDRMAFAYLLVNENKNLNEDATKRLKAISDFTELGSGIKISQRDLLIRGAGDILGPEQAGFIDSIGIDMYIKILNETIEEKKQTKKISKDIKLSNIKIDAYIPDSFVNNENKLQIYQDIISARTIEDLENERENIVDIYGKIPEEVEMLLIKKKLDIYLNMEEFEDLKYFDNQVTLILSEEFSLIEGIGTSLFTSLLPYIKNIKMSFIDKKIHIVLFKNDDYVYTLLKIFEIIIKLFNISKEDKENEIR